MGTTGWFDCVRRTDVGALLAHRARLAHFASLRHHHVVERLEYQLVRQEEQTEQFQADRSEKEILKDDFRWLGDRLLKVLDVVGRFGDDQIQPCRYQRRTNELILAGK